MKKKYFAVIDTEALGGAYGEFCPIYHLGAVGIDRQGEFLDSIDIVILQNLKLTSAYYGKTKAQYYKELLKNEDTIICYTEDEALEIFSDWLTDLGATNICAYNSNFDFERTCLNEIVDDYNFIDIWYAFSDTIGQTKKYQKFCADHGYLTKNGQNRMTAEIAYRFVVGDNDFVESHTALDDALIEAEILKAVWRTHKKFTQNEHKIKR